MTTSASIKLTIAAAIALLFAGFVLRAAMHSMIMLVLIVAIILWAAWKFR